MGQARAPDEGGTLRARRSQFSYAVPDGFLALAESLGAPDSVAAQAAEGWTECGGGPALGVARLDAWQEMGGAHDLGAARIEAWHEVGGTAAASVSNQDVWMERTIP